MKSVYESSNVWPLVQFHTIPFANENHPARPFPAQRYDWLVAEVLADDLKTAILEKDTDAVLALTSDLLVQVSDIAKKWGVE